MSFLTPHHRGHVTVVVSRGSELLLTIRTLHCTAQKRTGVRINNSLSNYFKVNYSSTLLWSFAMEHQRWVFFSTSGFQSRKMPWSNATQKGGCETEDRRSGYMVSMRGQGEENPRETEWTFVIFYFMRYCVRLVHDVEDICHVHKLVSDTIHAMMQAKVKIRGVNYNFRLNFGLWIILLWSNVTRLL